MTNKNQPSQEGENNIKRMRSRLGLTLAKLSNLTGISPQQINRVEKGQRELNYKTIQAMAKAFNCQPEDIIANAPTRPVFGSFSNPNQPDKATLANLQITSANLPPFISNLSHANSTLPAFTIALDHSSLAFAPIGSLFYFYSQNLSNHLNQQPQDLNFTPDLPYLIATESGEVLLKKITPSLLSNQASKAYHLTSCGQSKEPLFNQQITWACPLLRIDY